MINVLFVHPKSGYFNYPVIAWDEKKNASLFSSDEVVIAHPPCRLWSQMRAFSTADISEKNHAIRALEIVRKNGGILEHPVSSSFWKFVNIVKPGAIDEFGGFTISVNQNWFGYHTKKNTMLYIVGITPKELPSYPALNLPITRKFKNLSPKQRSETVPAFAEWLIEIASLIEKNKSTCKYSKTHK